MNRLPFAVLAICLVGASAQSATLRTTRTLHAPIVRLSDLFEDAGANANRVLGPGPGAGGRIVVEAAWSYRHRPAVGSALRQRQTTVSEEVKAIGWKAQLRLHARYRKLLGRGKCQQQVVTAVGRELLGFIWAIGVTVERAPQTPSSTVAAA